MAQQQTPARFGVEDQPTSDLTCNTSATTFKKRSRNNFEIETSQQQQSNSQQQQRRVYGSIGTSTSGSPATAVSNTPAGLPIAKDLSLFYQQGLEIDALARLQAERMRSELEVVRKRQCRELLSVLGRQFVNRINEKDAELARASQRNAELVQKLMEMAAQSQIWFNVAKNNDTVLCNLRSALQQALLQNTTSAAPSAEYCEYDPKQYTADDAESCCDAEPAVPWRSEELQGGTACRVCREKEGCVLILPCRHLCLCKDCEPAVDTCPVCDSTKNASLQILLS